MTNTCTVVSGTETQQADLMECLGIRLIYVSSMSQHHRWAQDASKWEHARVLELPLHVFSHGISKGLGRF